MFCDKSTSQFHLGTDHEKTDRNISQVFEEILKLMGHNKIKAIVNLNCFSKFEAEYTVNG